MIAVVSRIVLRYAAGGLVALGYLDSELGQQIGADPDILLIVGATIGAGVELVYSAARKFGWMT